MHTRMFRTRCIVARASQMHVGGGVALLLEKIMLTTGSCSIANDSATAPPWTPDAHDDDAPSCAAAAELAAGVADFYAALATPSAQQPGKLSIAHVVPPDEFATGFPL